MLNRQKIIEILRETARKIGSDFTDESAAKNPTAIISNIADNQEWVLALYKNILKLDIKQDDEGLKHWLVKLNQGMSRVDIENYFRQVAQQENQKNNIKQATFEDLLDKNDKGRVLIVCKESAGDIFLLTSLFKSIKNRYPDWSLYIATKPQFKDLLDGNPYVKKWLEWQPIFENSLWAEGTSTHNGYFDICYIPTIATQGGSSICYLHNGIDEIDLDLYY